MFYSLIHHSVGNAATALFGSVPFGPKNSGCPATPHCGYAGAASRLCLRYAVVGHLVEVCSIPRNSAHCDIPRNSHYATSTVYTALPLLRVCGRCTYPRGSLLALCGATLRTIGSLSTCFPLSATDRGSLGSPHRQSTWSGYRSGGGACQGDSRVHVVVVCE